MVTKQMKRLYNKIIPLDHRPHIVTYTPFSFYPRRAKESTGLVRKAFDWTLKPLLNLFNLQTKRSNNEDAFDQSKKRSNIMITVQLEDKSGDNFNIGTYHMPCAFRTPQVMTLHSELAVRRSMELAVGVEGGEGGVGVGGEGAKPWDEAEGRS